MLQQPEQAKVLKKGELIAHRFINGLETGKVVKQETSAACSGQYLTDLTPKMAVWAVLFQLPLGTYRGVCTDCLLLMSQVPVGPTSQ